jgi:hypothetical protein
MRLPAARVLDLDAEGERRFVDPLFEVAKMQHLPGQLVGTTKQLAHPVRGEAGLQLAQDAFPFRLVPFELPNGARRGGGDSTEQGNPTPSGRQE